MILCPAKGASGSILVVVELFLVVVVDLVCQMTQEYGPSIVHHKVDPIQHPIVVSFLKRLLKCWDVVLQIKNILLYPD